MEVDSDANSRFLDGTRSFVGWFRAIPGATFHNNIAVEDLRGQNAGRGIIATADIEPDTILFTIPRDAIVCAATSALQSQIPQIFNLDHDDADEDGDEDEHRSTSQDSWTLLILVMMYEYLQGDASRWRPYLDVLPTTFDTPMFWSPAELSELQASALVAKVGKEEADLMIKSKILAVIRAHEHVFFPAGSHRMRDEQLFELAHRMGSAIMAYAFDLEKDDENGDAEEDDEWVEDREGKTMLGMVPMADILNADAEFNAHINHSENALTAVALRPIRAGEEILNYYGPLSTGELLRRYGYVTPKHSRYDVVELPWGLVENELKERVTAGKSVDAPEWDAVKRITESDEEFDESFVLERSSDDPDSTGKLGADAIFDGLPDELGEQCKRYLKAVKKVTNAAVAAQALSDRDTRKELCLQSVLGALQSRERQYPTSLEDDEQLIHAGEVVGRQRMAVWVRRGEKQLLREAQLWIGRELDEMRSKRTRAHEDDAPAAKRRRC
ncbi:SET domain-containing protein [Trichocladium antarcticum]|uniref:SET domain-containing protein n=1 Tax=Trichocladium antarcticum TaxID=1450529 RepID=A0AAN6UCW8_9PEZI|nr:SET domain-containing protein [Trichocladium antarcticum]